MEEFDLTQIDDYTIEQLADFVIAGNTTVQELFEEGLFLYHRPILLKELEARDNFAWKEAVAKGTIDALNGYIAVYGLPSQHYQGVILKMQRNVSFNWNRFQKRKMKRNLTSQLKMKILT